MFLSMWVLQSICQLIFHLLVEFSQKPSRQSLVQLSTYSSHLKVCMNVAENTLYSIDEWGLPAKF